jgi:phosphoribosylaminoimidazole (AIR) synthetase
MLRTFNCGIGFIVVVKSKDAEKAIKALKALKMRAFDIGTVTKADKGDKAVEFTGGPLFQI